MKDVADATPNGVETLFSKDAGLMECIFCDNENDAKSIEHIVSESFGNKDYLMQKGEVCDVCNGRFSKFEGTALTNSVFIIERVRFGVETKKGRSAKGKVKDISFEGDRKFRENYLTVRGLTEENFKDFDPSTGVGNLVVATFDKSSVATSKLILKIGLESIYTSQRSLFNKYNFTELKDYLTTKSNADWPFLSTDFEVSKFNTVPRYTVKYRLKQNHCELKCLVINEKTLLFKFKYGIVPMTINLINRDLDWIEEALEQYNVEKVYPEHFRNKLATRK